MQLIDDIRRRECRRFAHAWQSWRGGSLVPQRHNVHIEDIANLLHLVSVIEIVSPHEANFRLAGTVLCQAMGIELTGLNYFDFTTPEERDARAARTCHLVDHPCRSHFLFPILYRTGRTVPTEILTFPVWPDNPQGAAPAIRNFNAARGRTPGGSDGRIRPVALARGFSIH